MRKCAAAFFGVRFVFDSQQKEAGMDKNVKNALMVGGVLVLVYLIAKRTAAKVTIGNPGVRIHKISFNGIELRIELPVLNESDIPAPVSAFLGQIYYGANPLGLVQLVQPVDLPGFGQAIVPFSAKLSLVSVGQQVYDMLRNPPIDWTKFSIKGTLKIGPIPVSVDEKLAAA